MRKATHKTAPASLPADQLLLAAEDVGRLLGISRRSVWRMLSQGHLPAPVDVPGIGGTRWRRADVEQWLAALPQQNGQLAKQGGQGDQEVSRG